MKSKKGDLKLSYLFNEFFKSEKTGGLILVLATIVSLLLANSSVSESYTGFWNYDISGHSLTHWINDGLMTIFFLLIGLELEREIYNGELSNIKNASLPLMAAIGGLLVPAGIYLLFNFGTNTQKGAGIPMATDIAFAIGVLSLLGKRVPTSLKVFLTALAVIDDIGAILMISIFYTQTIVWLNLLIAGGILTVLFALNRLKVSNLIPYIVGGVAMWYFMLSSGVHATVTGILVAFAIPFGSGKKGSTSYILERFLHKPVAFLILPLFAMANTCIALGNGWQTGITSSNSLGIMIGLIAGKPLGIMLFSFIGVITGICSLPSDINWKHLISVGFLGGIGFTMSIFITLLAFNDNLLINNSKIAILGASTLAGLIGFFLLKITLKKKTKKVGVKKTFILNS